MWWMFEIISVIDDIIIYAYSRGNRDLDRRISINKKTNEITLIQPCSVDEGSDFAEEKEIEKAWYIIDLGYPENKQIACG